MSCIIVIPARYDSTRFPGKPLVEIAGKSLLERTWRIASAVKKVEQVVVATDDERIVEHCKRIGARAVMTNVNCRNGTERVLEAVKKIGTTFDTVINLQGDAVLTPPWVIQPLVDEFINDPSVLVTTPAVNLTYEEAEQLAQAKLHTPGGTLVVFDQKGDALYFSKSMIPYLRNRSGESPIYRHIGLYGYRYEMLEKYVQLKPTPLELTEGLEQLRLLEHGFSIRVLRVNYRNRTHCSVDSPEDAILAAKIIQEEGELLEESWCD